MVRSVLLSERLLCHAELVVGDVAAPGGSLSARAEALAVMGALVIVGVDETQVRLRWDDVYTMHESESLDDLIDPEEAVLRANVKPRSPLVINEFFSRLGWVQDVVDGRQLVIEEATVRSVPWQGPETGPVDDTHSPSFEIVNGIESWLSDQGFVDNEFPTNYIRPITDEVGLCVGVAPQAFKMENPSRRHPVVVNVGVSHRPVNEFSDWLGGRAHRPQRWTLFEPAHFFNPSAQVVWHADTPLEQVISEIEPALEEAARLSEPDVLRKYFERNDPITDGFHRRNRVGFHLVHEWTDGGPQALAAWRETTTSQNMVTLAEATINKYLETNERPYYFESSTQD